jgi:hypothetical protein
LGNAHAKKLLKEKVGLQSTLHGIPIAESGWGARLVAVLEWSPSRAAKAYLVEIGAAGLHQGIISNRPVAGRADDSVAP